MKQNQNQNVRTTCLLGITVFLVGLTVGGCTADSKAGRSDETKSGELLPIHDPGPIGGGVKTYAVPFASGQASISVNKHQDGKWEVEVRSLRDVALNLTWHSKTIFLESLGEEKERAHNCQVHQYRMQNDEVFVDLYKKSYSREAGYVQIESVKDLASAYLLPAKNSAVDEALRQNGWNGSEQVHIVAMPIVRLEDFYFLPETTPDRVKVLEGLLAGDTHAITVGEYCMFELGLVHVLTVDLNPSCCINSQPGRIKIRP